ncbi:MARVEL domain-containing 3-like protein [Labeo rohita]|uniref:MARVEL domain-containing 3-like protein n=2 Tax=Labeo rohita TaxID=84645 RepID=A0A498M307_LABRO|nr:MARVEL domain-containing protein 3 [Labeo rohita]XP_050995437.1 MARVEL domain-containing protein 3 [Labeo rohita]KAI2651853.1 MARVEL domain-containing protein 3 [Labeo rohita]RXN15249.1 MARVEL domain-containing 3-like protein [Labeo rohita]
MSQPSRHHRPQRERNGGHYSERRDREPRSRRDNPNDRRSGSERSSGRPPYYPRGSQRHTRSAPREEYQESKCSYICSRRGIVLICAVLTNALVLICVVAAHMSQMGMSAMGMGGTSFIDAIIPFEGVELQQVRDLDMQYGQMRAPGVYGGVAFSLTFGALSLLFVVSSSKPPHMLPRKLLIGQFAFQIIGAVAYVVAVGLYLHFVISVNSTDVCVRRERLYARNGYTWMNCSVGGGDAAVALFGIITAILYAVGTILTGKTIRDVSRYFKERNRYEAERREQPKGHLETPLDPNTYV